MASTNKTTNIHLSQFVASDKPAWLTDYNNDMRAIDEAVGAAETAQAELSQQVSAQGESMDGLEARLDSAMADFEGGLFVDDTERQIGWCMTGKNGVGERLYKPHYEYEIKDNTPILSNVVRIISYSDYGIENSENVRVSKAYIQSPDETTVAPLPAVATNASMQGSYVMVTNTQLQFQPPIGWPGYMARFILHYTKTLDTAKTKAEVLTK